MFLDRSSCSQHCILHCTELESKYIYINEWVHTFSWGQSRVSVRFCEETQVVCHLALWLTHCVYHNIVYLIVVGLKITVCGAFMLLLLREGWMVGEKDCFPTIFPLCSYSCYCCVDILRSLHLIFMYHIYNNNKTNNHNYTTALEKHGLWCVWQRLSRTRCCQLSVAELLLASSEVC